MSFNFRKTTGAKISAVGFIALTLLGNLWLVQALFGRPIDGWYFNLFILFAGVVGFGALVLAVECLRAGSQPDSESGEE